MDHGILQQKFFLSLGTRLHTLSHAFALLIVHKLEASIIQSDTSYLCSLFR